MGWILAHIAEISLAILILDKIVAVTPVKWDDLILTAVKGALKAIIKDKGKPQDGGKRKLTF